MADENNERKSDFEKLLEDVKGKHSRRVNAILLTMSGDGEDNEAFLVNFFKVLEYASPKLQRTEVIEDAKEQVIRIEHYSVDKKK